MLPSDRWRHCLLVSVNGAGYGMARLPEKRPAYPGGVSAITGRGLMTVITRRLLTRQSYVLMASTKQRGSTRFIFNDLYGLTCANFKIHGETVAKVKLMSHAARRPAWSWHYAPAREICGIYVGGLFVAISRSWRPLKIHLCRHETEHSHDAAAIISINWWYWWASMAHFWGDDVSDICRFHHRQQLSGMKAILHHATYFGIWRWAFTSEASVNGSRRGEDRILWH